MLLGPGRRGYELILRPGPKQLVAVAEATYPRLRSHWRGIETLLRRQGHRLGVPVHFGRTTHRLVRFEAHPDGSWPSIDIVFMIQVDTVVLDLLVVEFDQAP